MNSCLPCCKKDQAVEDIVPRSRKDTFAKVIEELKQKQQDDNVLERMITVTNQKKLESMNTIDEVANGFDYSGNRKGNRGCCTATRCYKGTLLVSSFLLTLYLTALLFTPPCPGEFAALRGTRTPPIKGMKRLDLTRYEGKWYQMYRVNSTRNLGTDFGDCSTATYRQDDEDDPFK